jgi:flagellar M-ring protein FliF
MRGGHALEHGEVMGITHLVSSAVPGLEVSRVTVVDSHGRLLARGNGDPNDVAAGNAQEYRIAYESRTQQKLEDLIEKVIGVGKVRVEVSADMNFDRVVTNSEKYDPDGQVVRSTQSTSEKENSLEKTPKDSVSVGNNLPGVPGSSDNGGSSNHADEHTGETTNYEISKTIQNHVSEGGTINKLSVAVLVDGTYTGDSDKQAYAPRTEEELKQLKTLVASAIGYDEKRGDKIEVVNMRFTQESFNVANESFFERFKLEAQSIIQTLIIAIVAILAILLVLRPAMNQLIKQAQSNSQRVSGELAAIGSGGGGARLPPGIAGAAELGGGMSTSDEMESLIDVANIKGGMKSSSMKKINEIVDKYPEETMLVLRTWVSK